jgi:flagellar motor component MotA
MLTIGAFAFLLACVFGSYVLSGGSINVLAEALKRLAATLRAAYPLAEGKNIRARRR